MAVAHKIPWIAYARLRDGTLYEDPQVNYEEILARKNLPPWVRMLIRARLAGGTKEGTAQDLLGPVRGLVLALAGAG